MKSALETLMEQRETAHDHDFVVLARNLLPAVKEEMGTLAVKADGYNRMTIALSAANETIANQGGKLWLADRELTALRSQLAEQQRENERLREENDTLGFRIANLRDEQSRKDRERCQASKRF